MAPVGVYRALGVRVAVGLITVCAAVLIDLGPSPMSGASAPAPCAPAQISLHHGTPNGAAGTTYIPLVFTNRGSSCVLWGVPTIQPVRPRTRRPLGPIAHNLSIGEMPARHVLARGESVSAAMGVTDTANFPVALCAPSRAGGVVVSLGDFVHSRFVRVSISVCARRSSVTTRLLVPGTSGA